MHIYLLSAQSKPILSQSREYFCNNYSYNYKYNYKYNSDYLAGEPCREATTKSTTRPPGRRGSWTCKIFNTCHAGAGDAWNRLPGRSSWNSATREQKDEKLSNRERIHSFYTREELLSFSPRERNGPIKKQSHQNQSIKREVWCVREMLCTVYFHIISYILFYFYNYKSHKIFFSESDCAINAHLPIVGPIQANPIAIKIQAVIILSAQSKV